MSSTNLSIFRWKATGLQAIFLKNNNMEGMLKPGAFKGKTVIITGGGTGLGRSMGKYLLELGAQLVITSRKKEVLDKAAAGLMHETGGKVLAVACDIRKYDEVENVI